MSAHDPSLAAAETVAATLACTAVSLERVRGGGRNSRIYRVRAGPRSYALKQYPPRRGDPRDRLATEVGALRLMERHGIGCVPRVVAVDRDRGYVLLSWIEGVATTGITDSDIDAAVAFLGAIHMLRHCADANDQPMAAEACLSGAEIERQIDRRLASLRDSCDRDTELLDFLAGSFLPLRETLVASAWARISQAGLEPTADLPQMWRSLIPADFGFHNSLRADDGSLVFLDFEYFGWDDPVKLTADVLLHPGSSLTSPQHRRFRRAAERLYGTDPSFAQRLDAFVPLFGLRWVLILLNEFIPERWSARRLAGESETWAAAKARQLARARALLASFAEYVEK
jgi:hypothetical protein